MAGNSYTPPLHRDIKRAIAKAKLLTGVMGHIEIPNTPIPRDIRAIRREEFNTIASDNFFKWLATEHAGRMQDIGFSIYDLAEIAAYGREAYESTRPEFLMSYSMDHIRPIKFDGPNTSPNLCLIPSWINSTKAVLEFAQLQKNPNRSHIKTLAPPRLPNGEFNPLPHIPETLRTEPMVP